MQNTAYAMKSHNINKSFLNSQRFHTIGETQMKPIDKLTSLFSKKDKIIMMKCTDINIDPEFKALYYQEPEKVQAIADDMRKNGFDKSQPIIILADKTLIDGHSRLEAAMKAELTEIPVMIKEFDSRNDVLIYMEHLQLDRRNLSESEKMIHLEKLLKLKEQAKKEGRDVTEFSDEEIAKKLDVSPRQVQKMKEVEKKASNEQLEAIKKGERSVSQVHTEIKSIELPMKKSSIVLPKTSQKTPAVSEDDFIHGFKFAILELSKGRKPHEIYKSLLRFESAKPVFSIVEEKRLQEILCKDSIS